MFCSVETQDSLKNAEPPPPIKHCPAQNMVFAVRFGYFGHATHIKFRKREPFHSFKSMLMVCYILSHRRASRFHLGLVVAGHNQLCFFAENEEPCISVQHRTMQRTKGQVKKAIGKISMVGI
jgi:hypothetical protein